MKIATWYLGAIVLLAALPAKAQFELLAVNGGTSTHVTNLYSFGNISSGASVSQQFQIVNTASLPAKLTLLSVAGAGFTLSGGPTLPVQLNPQNTVNFMVTFQASTTGGYSASLNADGISVFLTATVVPGLTYEVEPGNQPLGSTPVAFGSLQVGQTASLTFLVNDPTQQALIIPAISVGPSDFSLSGPNPSNTALQPGKQTTFVIQFQPSAAGTRVGTLMIGNSTYYLTGTGAAIPTAQPQVSVTLSQAQSAQQGSVAVNFASPAPSGGSGTLTLQFQPLVAGASDPAIAFASGGQSATFTFSTGDVVAMFGSARFLSFETGTTAGTIIFSAQVGGASSQQSVTIAPAAVNFTATQASRSTASVQVQVTGFDNTRSAGQLTFTFYDDGGNVLAPGPISADAISAFAQYFTGSAGGNFLLNAVFPVVGDTSVVTYFEATFTNTAGQSTTSRTSLQ
jgi:hypothetical protein